MLGRYGSGSDLRYYYIFVQQEPLDHFTNYFLIFYRVRGILRWELNWYPRLLVFVLTCSSAQRYTAAILLLIGSHIALYGKLYLALFILLRLSFMHCAQLYSLLVEFIYDQSIDLAVVFSAIAVRGSVQLLVYAIAFLLQKNIS